MIFTGKIIEKKKEEKRKKNVYRWIPRLPQPKPPGRVSNHPLQTRAVPRATDVYGIGGRRPREAFACDWSEFWKKTMGRPVRARACDRRVYSNVTGNVYRRRRWLPRRSWGSKGVRRNEGGATRRRAVTAACGWAVGCTRDLLSQTLARAPRDDWQRRRRAERRNSAALHSTAVAAAAAARDPHDTIIMRV